MKVNWGKAVCASGELDFVSVRGGTSEETEALAACERCPIRWGCLEAELAAMRGDADTFGVVGGFTAAGRKALLLAEGKVVAIHTALTLASAEAGEPAAANVANATVIPMPAPATKKRKKPAAGNAHRREIAHGEANGAQQHRRRGEKPCPACAEAWRVKTRASVAATRARQRAAKESARIVA